MIRSKTEMQQAIVRLSMESTRLREHRGRLRELGMRDEEIARVMSPIEEVHVQLQSEVESFRRLTQGEFDDLVSLHRLGEVIVAARIAKGISQRELARRLKVHESQISRDEHNSYVGISVGRAIKILDALDVRLSIKVDLDPGKHESSKSCEIQLKQRYLGAALSLRPYKAPQVSKQQAR